MCLTYHDDRAAEPRWLVRYNYAMQCYVVSLHVSQQWRDRASLRDEPLEANAGQAQRVYSKGAAKMHDALAAIHPCDRRAFLASVSCPSSSACWQE